MSMIHYLSVLCMGAGISAGEVEFAEQPQVARHGKEVTISFVLSQAADVEVAVLGADGRVVRHLAAGVLGGEKAPPGPLQFRRSGCA